MTPSPNLPDALTYWKSLHPEAGADSSRPPVQPEASPVNPYGLGPGAAAGAAVNPFGIGPETPSNGAGGVPDALTYYHQQHPERDTSTDQTNKAKTPPPESVTDFLFNQAPHSIVNAAQNLTHAAIHPIDTGNALGNLIAGTFKAAARGVGVEMPENESDQVARGAWQYLKNRYGSVDAAKESLYHDPVGVLMDLSTAVTGAGGVVRGAGVLADVAGAARTAEAAGALGRGLTTVGKVTNPLYVPGKVVSGAVGRLTSKAPPAFDPTTATFENEVPAFDPKTGTFDPSVRRPAYTSPPVEQSPEAIRNAIRNATRQRAQEIARTRTGTSANPSWSDWEQAEQQIQAEQEIRNRVQSRAQPAAQSAAQPTAPAGQTLAQNIRSVLTSSLGGGAITAEAINLLTHHILGSVGGGFVAGAAIKYLPQLLKGEAVQQMLAKIGPGSTPAEVAGVARALVPALNTLYQSQLKKQSMGERSVFDRAKGGMVNPELARIQRERLRLPGILETLERRK